MTSPTFEWHRPILIRVLDLAIRYQKTGYRAKSQGKIEIKNHQQLEKGTRSQYYMEVLLSNLIKLE